MNKLLFLLLFIPVLQQCDSDQIDVIEHDTSTEIDELAAEGLTNEQIVQMSGEQRAERAFIEMVNSSNFQQTVSMSFVNFLQGMKAPSSISSSRNFAVIEVSELNEELLNDKVERILAPISSESVNSVGSARSVISLDVVEQTINSILKLNFEKILEVISVSVDGNKILSEALNSIDVLGITDLLSSLLQSGSLSSEGIINFVVSKIGEVVLSFFDEVTIPLSFTLPIPVGPSGVVVNAQVGAPITFMLGNQVPNSMLEEGFLKIPLGVRVDGRVGVGAGVGLPLLNGIEVKLGGVLSSTAVPLVKVPQEKIEFYDLARFLTFDYLFNPFRLIGDFYNDAFTALKDFLYGETQVGLGLMNTKALLDVGANSLEILRLANAQLGVQIPTLGIITDTDADGLEVIADTIEFTYTVKALSFTLIDGEIQLVDLEKPAETVTVFARAVIEKTNIPTVYDLLIFIENKLTGKQKQVATIPIDFSELDLY